MCVRLCVTVCKRLHAVVDTCRHSVVGGREGVRRGSHRCGPQPWCVRRTYTGLDPLDVLGLNTPPEVSKEPEGRLRTNHGGEVTLVSLESRGVSYPSVSRTSPTPVPGVCRVSQSFSGPPVRSEHRRSPKILLLLVTSY